MIGMQNYYSSNLPEHQPTVREYSDLGYILADAVYSHIEYVGLHPIKGSYASAHPPEVKTYQVYAKFDVMTADQRCQTQILLNAEDGEPFVVPKGAVLNKIKVSRNTNCGPNSIPADTAFILGVSQPETNYCCAEAIVSEAEAIMGCHLNLYDYLEIDVSQNIPSSTELLGTPCPGGITPTPSGYNPVCGPDDGSNNPCCSGSTCDSSQLATCVPGATFFDPTTQALQPAYYRARLGLKSNVHLTLTVISGQLASGHVSFTVDVVEPQYNTDKSGCQGYSVIQPRQCGIQSYGQYNQGCSTCY
jgi:hypothetical protein